MSVRMQKGFARHAKVDSGVLHVEHGAVGCVRTCVRFSQWSLVAVQPTVVARRNRSIEMIGNWLYTRIYHSLLDRSCNFNCCKLYPSAASCCVMRACNATGAA
eukprot:6210060-Pleurochrysis_carterae.AAC.1